MHVWREGGREGGSGGGRKGWGREGGRREGGREGDSVIQPSCFTCSYVSLAISKVSGVGGRLGDCQKRATQSTKVHHKCIATLSCNIHPSFILVSIGKA